MQVGSSQRDPEQASHHRSSHHRYRSKFEVYQDLPGHITSEFNNQRWGKGPRVLCFASFVFSISARARARSIFTATATAKYTMTSFHLQGNTRGQRTLISFTLGIFKRGNPYNCFKRPANASLAKYRSCFQTATTSQVVIHDCGVLTRGNRQQPNMVTRKLPAKRHVRTFSFEK
jgi:hypothetical protein